MKNRYCVVSICVLLLVPILAATDCPPTVTVTGAFAKNGSSRAGLGDDVTVQVHSLQSLQDSSCLNSDASGNKQNIALFLNGMPLRGIVPVPDIYKETLRYTLQRTNQTKDVWSALLGSPTGTTREVSVSVGPENGYPLQTKIEKFNLVVLRPFWSIMALAIVTSMLIAFFKLAKRSALLRDPGPAKAASDETTNLPGGKIGRKINIPYSLGRFQMAVWFLLVVMSFLFLWLVTGQLDTLPAQVLALMGIGAGTALGSSLIDASKSTESQSTVASLEAEKSTLGERIEYINHHLQRAPTNKTELENKNELETELTAKRQRQSALEDELKKAHKALNPIESQGFFKDILSDANGITFHRFQLLVWTVVLGFIFCASVYRSLAMPQFSDTLLALVGITSGTYIGFKFPEQHTK